MLLSLIVHPCLGGPYTAFCFVARLLSGHQGDVSTCSAAEKDVLNNWFEFFSGKYDIVGKLVSDEEFAAAGGAAGIGSPAAVPVVPDDEDAKRR